MKPLSRILVLIASLVMIGGFFFPVWSIELQAPQYPEGLGMKIWIDKLSGDIQIINGLNHYIGMKHIDAAMFPEFEFMKYILGALIGLGIFTAALGKKPVLYIWFGLLLISAAAGMYDFWAWEYDYGHNLDPRAAIIVPGMSYQPPLWGYKDLLNFRAGSFPDMGGWAIIIGGVLSAAAVIFELFRKTKTEKAIIKINVPEVNFSRRASVSLSAIALLVGLSSCASGPQPIAYGKDGCEHCKMTIMDPKFGAELINKNGKVFKFDSGECMIGYLKEGRIALDNVSELLVTDFANPQTLTNARTAYYLYSEAIPSPMGANVSAFAASEKRDQAKAQKSGTSLTWNDFYKTAGNSVAMGH